ncbi:hypothetical protein [Halospeciosus flavus]|uniref:hypothetical protein n=1 Tax=Halospeciosus flavus TaxID=3032283 RepID=UPI003612EA12
MSETETGAAPDVRTEEPRDYAAGLKYTVGALFWGWILLRWLNDWFGGVLVPRGQAFVPPSTFAALADSVPLFAGSSTPSRSPSSSSRTW